MNREQECYGKMFPSIVEMARNTLVTGKVFGYRRAWQRCLECPDLETVNTGFGA